MDKIQEVILKQKLLALAQSGKFLEAEQLSCTLLRKLPNDLELWFALAQISLQLEKRDQALQALLKVTSRDNSNYLRALLSITELCVELDQHELGLQCARKILEIDVSSALANYQCGYFLVRQKKLGLAEQFFAKAVQLEPSNPSYQLLWGEALTHKGNIKKALAVFETMKGLDQEDDRPYLKSLMYQNYSHNQIEGAIFKAHVAFGQRLEQRYPNIPPFPKKATSRLKVGYLSPDFRRHSVSYFIGPVLQGHSRTEFEVYCYSDVEKPDAVTEQLKSYSEHWLESCLLDDQQLYNQIRNDRIDILVDLAAYTGRRPRIEVFARRAAPIQMTYLGYPNTTGLSRMDYRLVDGQTDPVGESDTWCSETLIRMSKCFLCFSPEENTPEVQSAPVNRVGKFTFGAFNAYLKITDEILQAWAEILRQVPQSQLYVKAEVLADKDQADEFIARCKNFSINPSRLIVAGQTPNRTLHLNEYHKVDLHLDTYPYNGTTTTLEAMWMGVPTVTLAGKSHRSRVGNSLLRALDLQDFIAESMAQYIDIAVTKALDSQALVELRQELRKKLIDSPLMDVSAFVTELEQHYKNIALAPPGTKQK